MNIFRFFAALSVKLRTYSESFTKKKRSDEKPSNRKSCHICLKNLFQVSIFIFIARIDFILGILDSAPSIHLDLNSFERSNLPEVTIQDLRGMRIMQMLLNVY
jgi:hypothetical protein